MFWALTVTLFLAYTLLAHRWQQVRLTWHGHATAPNTSCIIQKAVRSGPLVPATAVTRCSVKNALRYALRPRWVAIRVGWLNICSFLALNLHKAKTLLCCGIPICMRQNQLCDAHSCH